MLEPFRSSVHVQLPSQSSTAGVAHVMEASPLIPTIWRCRPHRSSLLPSAPPEVRRSACCAEHLGTEVPQQQPKTTPRTARSDDGPPLTWRQLGFEVGNGSEPVRSALPGLALAGRLLLWKQAYDQGAEPA